jgi:hypothetical protein
MIENNKGKTDEPIITQITKQSEFYMILGILFVVMLVFLQGCSHKQFRAYLLDIDTKKNEKSGQKINPSELNVALIEKNDNDIFNPVSKRVITPTPVMNSILSTDNSVLNKSRKDIENFYVTARYLRMGNMAEDLEIFTEIAEEYLSKRINPLIKDRMMYHSPAVRRVLTELQYYKANLQYEIEDMESACETVLDLESSENHEAGEDLEIISQRFKEIRNSYLVMTDFSYMCK